MVNELELIKCFKRSGSRLIKDFLFELQKAFQLRIVKYANHKLKYSKTGGFEHAFYWGEQRTKSYITAALDEVCDSNFIQEYFVERKILKSKKSSKIKNGRVDYLCQYGSTSVIDILLEVKQNWIRYKENNESTHYSGTTVLHHEAVKQLKSIHQKMDFRNKSLFGVAMTILPIFTRYPTKDASIIRLSRKKINEIAQSAMKIAKANCYGYFLMPKQLLIIDEWDYGKKTYESYPGVIIIYTINKYSRK